MTPPQEVPPEIGALLASLTEQMPSNDPSVVMHAALAGRSAAPLQPPPPDDEVAAFGRAVDDAQHTLPPSMRTGSPHWFASDR